MDYREFGERFRLELNRLGLDPHDSPYGVLGLDNEEAAEEFFTHLRSLPGSVPRTFHILEICEHSRRFRM